VKIKSINRRRFLKYAGATVAVVGASVLGLDYLLRPTPPIKQAFTSSTEVISTTSLSSTSSLTTSETSTTGALPPLNLGANDLGGYVFHDYSGNGALDEGEPFVNDVEIVAQGYYATFKVKPQNGIYVFKNLPGGRYRLYPVHPQNKVRYMCRSGAELVETRQGYNVDFRGRQRQDMALMEGFLTLPFTRGTTFRWGDLFDEGGGIDWMGQTGHICLECHNGPHEGYDLLVPWGTEVVASAPGKVKYIDDWSSEGWPGQRLFLIVSYDDEIKYPTSSLYAHMSKVVVEPGQFVSRGQLLGLSGGAGVHNPLEHLHFELDLGFHGSLKRRSPYHAIDMFRSLWQKGAVGYWTKDNQPQYPAV